MILWTIWTQAEHHRPPDRHALNVLKATINNSPSSSYKNKFTGCIQKQVIPPLDLSLQLPKNQTIKMPGRV